MLSGRRHGVGAEPTPDTPSCRAWMSSYLFRNTAPFDAQAAIEQVGLEARLVRGQRFRLERQSLVGDERPRVDAAALEARRDRRVRQELRREAIVGDQAPVRAITLEAARDAVDAGEQAVRLGEQCARRRRGAAFGIGAVRIGTVVGVVLLVLRVTHAAGDAQRVRRVDRRRAEHRLGGAGRGVRTVQEVDGRGLPRSSGRRGRYRCPADPDRTRRRCLR